jgi:aminoglycoside phosphotransferase (APT) family kinase protein
MSAAARTLPVPRVLEAVEFSDDAGHLAAALLLSRLPGRPAGDCGGLSMREARRRGEACERLHASLQAVAAPSGLAFVQGVPAVVSSTAACLLHLDLRPLNVLMDDDGEVTGVVDWANTAAGPAVLDRARTWSTLALDPAARRFREEPRSAALAEGWSRTAAFEHLPAAARAWACQNMLDDLATRYSGHRLDHVRQCLSRPRARCEVRRSGPQMLSRL